MTQIQLKRNRPGSQPAPATIEHIGYGRGQYLRIRTADGLDFSLGGDVQTWLDLLTPILADLRSVAGHDPSPTAAVMEHRQVMIERHFSNITIQDITAEMTPAEKWDVLIRRFEGSPQMEAEVELFKEQYRQAAGRKWGDEPELYQSRNDDLRTIIPHVADLLDDDGQPVWGAQSKVADLLGLPGTGGSYRRRIKDTITKLQKVAA